MRFQQFDGIAPSSNVQHLLVPSLEESPRVKKIRLLNESVALENDLLNLSRLEVQQRVAALKSHGSLRSFRRDKGVPPKPMQLSAPDRTKVMSNRTEEDSLWSRVLTQDTPVTAHDYQQEVDKHFLRADMDAYAQHFQNCADTTPEIDVWTDAVMGEVTSFGSFPYKHQIGEKYCYMIRLGTLEVWGVDLERCMVEYDIDIGDKIALKRVGKVPVVVMQNVIDELGDIIGEEQVTVDRVSWIAKHLR